MCEHRDSEAGFILKTAQQKTDDFPQIVCFLNYDDATENEYKKITRILQ